LLVDEDSQDKILVAKLKDAGHNVLTVKDVDLMGQPDHVVLAHAVDGNRIVLTRNCEDFCNEAQALKDG
jgi:predicted nuclease of predicted toxin-antitoxin system